jgi:hypothetical protein
MDDNDEPRTNDKPATHQPRTDQAGRVASRAAELLPEELSAGSADPDAQAQAILEDSDERSGDQSARQAATVEHRTSEDATEPPA